MTPTLLTIGRRAFEGEVELAKGSTLLLAVSGGPDSMALLHVTARLSDKLGLSLHAHGVDHGLRKEAKHELDRAEELATKLSVAWSRSKVRIAKGGNLQARAREARWAALAKAARSVGATAIATAHHADDRAETLLLRMLRGAGARGLGVMPARAPLFTEEGAARKNKLEVVRPLLRARRSDVMLHLDRHNVPFSLDPSNEDRSYLRSRVRRDLLPLLEELDPGIVRHLEAIADDLVRIARGTDGNGGGDFSLPRKTQEALVALARSRSKTARVWLPSSLVATYEDRTRKRGDGSRGRKRGP